MKRSGLTKSIVLSRLLLLSFTLLGLPVWATDPPPNDQFENRIALVTSVPHSVTNELASRQVGEPRHEDTDGGVSVWWEWTAFTNGLAALSVSTRNFSPAVGVYEGNTIDGLTPLELLNVGGIGIGGARPSVNSTYHYYARAGNTYRIAIDSRDGIGGSVTVTAGQYTGPANDLFEHRQVVSGNQVTVTNSNAFAWRELGEPNHAGHSAGASLWWTWTAPQAGRYEFDSSISGIATAFAVYRGNALSDLVELTANGLVPHPPVETRNLRWFLPRTAPPVVVQSGETVQIAIDTSSSVQRTTTIFDPLRAFPATAHLVLQIRRLGGVPGIPPHDPFSSASNIPSSSVTLANDTSYATREAGEPMLEGANETGTLWYRWTAPNDGAVTLTNRFAGQTNRFHPWVGVYTGGNVTNLSLMASNNYAFGWERCGEGWYARDALSFKVTSGVRYAIAIGGGPGELEKGGFELDFRFRAAPSNSRFANRSMIGGALVQRTGDSNIGARKEPGEPSHAGNPGGSSVWYQWRAPGPGSVEVLFEQPEALVEPVVVGGSGATQTSQQPGGDDPPPACEPGRELNPPPVFFPVAGVYSGSSVDNLTTLGGGTNVVVRTQGGADYQIAWDGNLGSMGTADLVVRFTPPPSNDNFANGLTLSGTDAIGEGYLRSTTIEPGEPADGWMGSVWFRWTALTFGTARARFVYSDVPHRLVVFHGDAVGNLKPLTRFGNDERFFALAGETYHIGVFTESVAAGNYKLQILAPGLTTSSPNLLQLQDQQYQFEFGGLSGQVAILQARNGASWTNVLVRTLSGAEFTGTFARAMIGDGAELRVVTIPEALPAVQTGTARLVQEGISRRLRVNLQGIPQQRVHVSRGGAIGRWTSDTTNVLNGESMNLEFDIDASPAHFIRIGPVAD